MSVKEEYLDYRRSNDLKTADFSDRVKLQTFLRERLDKIWAEKPKFTNGGLLSNHMTGFALGFAYYDCRPTAFCRTRCYGLSISGLYDYYMLRLSVITSESLKNGDSRFLSEVIQFIKSRNLKCLKIGHWGDAVIEQVQQIATLVKENSLTAFWWYTRKKEIALAVNQLELPNLRAYLSLDPMTEYPLETDYPYGFTYLFGDGIKHPNHPDIVQDRRLVALFPLKIGRHIEDPEKLGIGNHHHLCEEKRLSPKSRVHASQFCLSCFGRCNFSVRSGR